MQGLEGPLTASWRSDGGAGQEQGKKGELLHGSS